MDEIAADFYKLMPAITKLDVSKVIKSPMPGLVKSVSCNVGMTVN